MDSTAFVNETSEFARRYAAKMDCRWPTFKAALNLAHQRFPQGGAIVETGCARQKDDWGGGQSTLVLADFASTFPGWSVTSVDLAEQSVSACRGLLGDLGRHVTLVKGDSVAFLQQRADAYNKPIELLYLDSFDYPYVTLLNRYGGPVDGVAPLWAMTHEEVVAAHPEVVLPCQEHCLNEIRAASSMLSKKSIVLIDDNGFPGGGKSRLAKTWLHEHGWHCVYDYQQTLWIHGGGE